MILTSSVFRLRRTAAILVLGCAGTAWASTVTVSGALGKSQSNNYFVYNVTDLNGMTTETAKLIGNNPIPGGLPITQSFTIPPSVASGYATLLGLYDVTNNLVTVVELPSVAATAIANAQSFSQTFPGADETTIAGYLKTGNTTGLTAFLDGYKASFVKFDGLNTTNPGTNVSYSNAAADGSISIAVQSSSPAAATPEPASFVLAASSLIPLLLYRNRRRR